MPSRYSAARPSRASEAFARAHHGEQQPDKSSQNVTFDVRNPSALAPDAPDEEDVVLQADVIGRAGGATKRGAVNIDGYDSDSDNETFNTRAEARTAGRSGGGASSKKKKKGGEPEIDIADQLDNYNARLKQGSTATTAAAAADEDEAEEDMFAGSDEEDGTDDEGAAEPATNSAQAVKSKQVRFLDASAIQGQEASSRSGGHVHITNTTPGAAGAFSDEDDDEEDDPAAAAVRAGLDNHTIADEDEARLLAIQEEGLDEEVGAGGLKHHAPKIDAFNMKSEQEEGAFDESGNFIRRARDADDVHDRWLEGVSKRDTKKAAAAHAKRMADAKAARREDDGVVTADLLGELIGWLETGETALEALARLGRVRAANAAGGLGGSLAMKKKKVVPKWKLKKMAEKKAREEGVVAAEDVEEKEEAEQGDEMDVDKEKASKDPEQVKLEEAVEAITEAADKLLGREYTDIYDTERESLMREYTKESGETWMPKASSTAQKSASALLIPQSWEYRWTDGRDGNSHQGPYDGPTMQAWKEAGFFGEGVEFRPAGLKGASWSRLVKFV